MRNPFRKQKPEPQYLTVEEAVAQGIIDPEAMRRPFIPTRGVSVIDWDSQVQVHYPSWDAFKTDKKETYLGIPEERKSIKFHHALPRMREPIIDLGPGVTDTEYRASRGFLLDQGIAQGPEE